MTACNNLSNVLNIFGSNHIFWSAFVVEKPTEGEHGDSSPKGCWDVGCIPPVIKIQGKKIHDNYAECTEMCVDCFCFLITHRYEYVQTPNTRHQVEHTQLTRFIELGVLALGEVEAPDDFLQHNRSCKRLLFQLCHSHKRECHKYSN